MGRRATKWNPRWSLRNMVGRLQGYPRGGIMPDHEGIAHIKNLFNTYLTEKYGRKVDDALYKQRQGEDANNVGQRDKNYTSDGNFLVDNDTGKINNDGRMSDANRKKAGVNWEDRDATNSSQALGRHRARNFDNIKRPDTSAPNKEDLAKKTPTIGKKKSINLKTNIKSKGKLSFKSALQDKTQKNKPKVLDEDEVNL